LLQGCTVLDLSSVGPASRASRWLADYGARVVKIGPVSKKSGVQIRPPFFSYSGGRGLEKMLIDLKTKAGVETFLKLVESADVVIESFRPGVVDRIGIGYETCKARNPGIVYCATSGFGQTGPYSKCAGHDINYLGVGGYLDVTEARADGGPPIPGATIADSAAGGMQSVMAILAALVGKNSSGEGAYLDVSVADGVLALMSLNVDEYLALGTVPKHRAQLLTGRYAFYDTYQAADGGWLAVGAIEPHFYANLCKALGLEKWIAHQQDDAVQDEIRADFRTAFKTKDRDTWVEELMFADTCVSPVYSVPELTQDRQFREREVFASAEADEHGDFEMLSPVFAGMDRKVAKHRVRSHEDTDTEAVLASAGFAPDAVAQLRADGIVE